jgi:hypothetical protein
MTHYLTGDVHCFLNRHDAAMQESGQALLADGSDNFFTIDESYCPTTQNHPLVFDDVIRNTIWYYIENVRYPEARMHSIDFHMCLERTSNGSSSSSGALPKVGRAESSRIIQRCAF